ncbi:MAG TPA: hypothetical protein VMH86_00390 [Rhizomicrobium sp.]|nr:hypothetical protein [Rhizomicrobium sp.]
MIDNIPRIFTTRNGHQPPSRYYVYRDGLIRVKLAARAMSVSPGKNICFVDNWALTGWVPKFFEQHVELDMIYTYFDLMHPDSEFQYDGPGRRPLDFHLTPFGTLGPHEGRRHRGHPIVEGFDATIGHRRVQVNQLDEYIQHKYGYVAYGMNAVPAGNRPITAKIIQKIT